MATPIPNLDAISDDVKAVLLRSGTAVAIENTQRRAQAMTAKYVTEVEIDVDGTLAPIDSDPMASRPVPAAVEALQMLRDRSPLVQIVSGRNAAYFIEKLPQWGLVGVNARPLYGSEELGWNGDQPIGGISAEAVDGMQRLEAGWPAVREVLEQSGFTLSNTGASGELYTNQKGHMQELQFMNLDEVDQQKLRDALSSELVQDLLAQHSLVLSDWHDSGSVEILSIQVNKRGVAERARVTERSDGLPKPQKFIFFCDDTGDEELAKYIRENKLGIVVTSYNPPDKDGRKGTSLGLLKNADCVLVGSDVAKHIGLKGVEEGLRPQDRMGAWMHDFAQGMSIEPLSATQEVSTTKSL